MPPVSSRQVCNTCPYLTQAYSASDLAPAGLGIVSEKTLKFFDNATLMPGNNWDMNDAMTVRAAQMVLSMGRAAAWRTMRS